MTLPDHRTYMATRHFGSLDGLRFICIGAVLWHHASIMRTSETLILKRGFTGVDFFFVISGFLITTLLLRERAARGEISLKGFYRRRILRIVPVYFFVVSCVAGYYILLKGETQYLEILPYYYLFLSNYLVQQIPTLGITWSLSVEEQYYVVWPLLLIMLKPRWLPWVIAGLVCLNVLAVTGALAPLGIRAFAVGPLYFKMFTATFAPILLGSAAALLLDNARGFVLAARLFGFRWMPWLLFALVLLLLQFLPNDLTGLPNLALHLAMTAMLISIVLREDNGMRGVLTISPIARIGQISYGIYLYHLLALDVTNRMGFTAGWSQVLIYSALSILIAEISFRTLEAYFQRMRAKSVGSVGSAERTS